MSDVRRKLTTFRMATSREKLKAHRKKLSESRTTVRLLEPIADAPSPERIKTKIKAEKPRSALVVGEGRSMDMEVD
jgi:large subunit ribosomal protein L24e